MTFDKVVEIIWGNTLGIDASDEPGKKDFIIKDDMVATGREALTFLINKLKDNYIPTIKMTKAEQVILLNYMEMYSFREFMEVVLYQDDLYQTLSDEEIAQAWLHPETIKVVDDDVS